MRYIVTHDGYAHRDDFYCCCIALATYGIVPIYRRQPTRLELHDSTVMVLDVGLVYRPEVHSFDYHQHFGTNNATTLSLLLRYLNLDYICSSVPWYQNFFLYDHRVTVMSPIEYSLLNIFSSSKIFEIYNNFTQEMYGIGSRIISDSHRIYQNAIFHGISSEVITIYGKSGIFFDSEIHQRAVRYLALHSDYSFVLFRKGEGFCIITFDDLNFREIHHKIIERVNEIGTVVYTTVAKMYDVIHLLGMAISTLTTTREVKK